MRAPKSNRTDNSGDGSDATELSENTKTRPTSRTANNGCWSEVQLRYPFSSRWGNASSQNVGCIPSWQSAEHPSPEELKVCEHDNKSTQDGKEFALSTAQHLRYSQEQLWSTVNIALSHLTKVLEGEQQRCGELEEQFTIDHVRLEDLEMTVKSVKACADVSDKRLGYILAEMKNLQKALCTLGKTVETLVGGAQDAKNLEVPPANANPTSSSAPDESRKCHAHEKSNSVPCATSSSPQKDSDPPVTPMHTARSTTLEYHDTETNSITSADKQIVVEEAVSHEHRVEVDFDKLLSTFDEGFSEPTLLSPRIRCLSRETSGPLYSITLEDLNYRIDKVTSKTLRLDAMIQSTHHQALLDRIRIDNSFKELQSLQDLCARSANDVDVVRSEVCKLELEQKLQLEQQYHLAEKMGGLPSRVREKKIHQI